ncbi:hypothetical protein PP7435_CHR4-0149 [Komagataella phaffii CBS 7435]|uniref:TLC domain-containing protein n=2 Tax=Komagataella phaffii TaxID=460519 RepID=C4R8Z6_KOMPG|nr:uncharacterized protein PAS_chr4_0801 [Komagataella phaffii GS115]AOA65209.1 GQ67_05193T0 [Komagataella phaffii]CAH2450520.1 hypothetical protein BQ9382_C4-0805 [Komagataella phaffii CBS 7435]AOA69547.1 GQ68_05175T0 [Komagataella phaffii GS115]CAY72071.1 Putative protein of unknown function [Komagataella phaffii GS115]CCA40324.1 hypothetical protein PP7435_CHR4-0149 [Komagataella phaffii CBS 7435]
MLITDQLYYYFNYYRSIYQYDDPLKNLRVPLVQEYIQPYAPKGVVSQHIHEIVASFLVYQSLFTISRLFVKFAYPKFYNSLKPKTRIDFSIHIVSFVQSLLILILCIPLFKNPHLQQDHVFASTPYGQMVVSVAVGYFIWDALTCLLYIKYFGVEFFLHGVVSALVFLVGLSPAPVIMYYAPIFLLFEVSTPFLNIRWLAIKFPTWISDTVKLINNIILILLFFLIRICWGWYQVFRLANDFYGARGDPRLNWFNVGVILGSNLVLDLLNFYWFGKMLTVAINTLRKMFGAKADDRKLNLM